MESKLEKECRSGSNGEEDKSLRLPSSEPDLANIILCSDSDHREDKDDKENKDGERRVLDVQRDDLASRRLRMNQTKVRVSGLPVPSTCNSKDRELWERIRLSAQLSVLKRMEDLKQQKMRAELENMEPKEPRSTTTVDHQESESVECSREELQSDQGKDDRSGRSQAQRLNWPTEQRRSHGKSSLRERTGHDRSVMRDGQEVGNITQDKKLRKQHDGLLEYKDQWQDDLARWKNHRRRASQEPIGKEEERKTVEKLMTADGSLQSIKSYKIYKEIVEKEHEEQELHQFYLQPSTPDKMATVLEKLQLFPAGSPTPTGVLNADQWQNDLVRWKNRRRRTCEDLIRKEVRKMVEKLMMSEGTNQTSYKPVKNSVNGNCGDGLIPTPVTAFLAPQKPEEQLSPAGDAAYQKSTQTPSTIINDKKAKVTKEEKEGPNCLQMKRCKEETSTSTIGPEKTAVETQMIMDSCEVRLHCKDDKGDRADADPDTSHCRCAQHQPGIMEGF